MADVRVTGLPAASSLASGDVLHGVQAADSQDKKFSLSDLSTFFASGAPVASVFGRTGAIVATNGDYDIGELGDVDLSVAPTSGQFLKWDGSNWIADNTPAVVVDLAYSSAASNGTVTNTAGTNATIPGATTLSAGLFSATDKLKLDGIAAGAQTGTVTSVSGGTGLTGTVTTSGSISLANTAVSPGSYTLANITIDAQGRITAASNGSAGSGTVTSIATSAPITGGTITTSGTIGISAATTSAAGSMSAADKSKLDGIAPGATANTGTVTSIATSGAITGGTITTSGTITARAATTGQTGVVQLTDSTGSTSTTTAATPNSVKSANDNANGRLSTSGGTMTGGVYQTVRTISNNTAWNMSTGNLWHFAGGTIANPTNATAGMSGLIRVAAAVSGWGTNFDFPGGTQVSPAAFPALIPYYVSGTNVIMIGTPIEGIT